MRWRWCSFPPATFAVCQSARQSRAAARVLAAARTTGTLTLSSPRAPAESSRLARGSTSWMRKYWEHHYL